MMKWLATLLLLLPLISAAQLKTDFKKTDAPIPPFSLVKTDGSKITNTVLKKGKPAWVMIFSPQCDHCERVLDTLKSMAAEFKNTQLVLVTEARNKDLLKNFITKTELEKYPAFRQIGWDGGNLIYYLYTYQLLPQVNVYSSTHKLVRTFTGVFAMDSLKQYVQ